MRLNIRTKVTIIIISIVFVILAVVYLYLNQNLKSYTFDRIRKDLRKDITLAKFLVEEKINTTMGLSGADTIADQMSRDFGLRVTIINEDGKVMGDSSLNLDELRKIGNHLFRPEVQAAIKSGAGESRRWSSTVDTELLYQAIPVENNGFNGIIRLAIPLSEINLISANLRQLLFFALIIAFVLAVILSYMASVFISNPIKEISRVADLIARGDFSQKYIVHTNDEIETLSRSLSHMSDEIRERIEEVTSSKSRLEAVFLSMIEGVMVVDADGQIILMNQTLKNFLRVEKDPIGSKPLEIIRNIEIQDIADKILSAPAQTQSRELVLHMPEEKTLLIHATSVLREGVVDGGVMIFHDITDLRQLEKVRRDFVANVSHELRTPVATIKGYAETLLSGALEDKENAIEFLQIIYKDSDRLAKLITDLLDLARIESGKLSVELKDVSLGVTIKRVVHALEGQAEAGGVTLNIDLLSEVSTVHVDENSIAQIFLNLIENAIKYNKPNGSVTVTLSEDAQDVIVTVKDTGMGIPEQDLPRIFERFYRVDKAHSREIGGTGLGLAIVKHLVQANNGRITVDSVAGQGTQFQIVFPKKTSS